MQNLMRLHGRVSTKLLYFITLFFSVDGVPLNAQESKNDSVVRYEVIALQNAQASDVSRSAQAILGRSKVSIIHDDRTNSLIVRGTEVEVAEVKEVLELLDKKETGKQEKEPATLRVYPLKYVDAGIASSVLQSTIKSDGARLTADVKLNQLVLLGDAEAHQTASKILVALDQVTEQKREMTKILNSNDLSFDDKDTQVMLNSLARQHNIEFQFSPALGLATARGKTDAVEDFLSVVSQFEQRQQEAEKTQVKQAQERSYAIRVVWLLASDKESIPDGLQEISRRAQKFGITNLKLISQMLASTSVEGVSATDFQVSGPVKIEGHEEPVEFTVEGAISAIDDDATAFQLAVRFAIQSPSSSIISTGEMDIQLGVGKPVMVAMAPTELGQSILAIEVIEQ